MLIVGIYALNSGKDLFYKKLGQLIRKWNYDQIILLGDFNGVMEPGKDKASLDTKRSNINVGGRLPKSLFEIVEDKNLIDIWRMHNANSWEYTFFLDRHKSHSRIDLIFTTKQLIPYTKKVEILPQTMSDHNPVIWTGKERKATYQWRLNDFLMNKEENVNRLKDETLNFFKVNLGNKVQTPVVWDSYKAVMRGILMKMGFEYKKCKELEIENIQKLI